MTSHTVALTGAFLLLIAAETSGQIIQNGSFENNFTSWSATGHQVIRANDPAFPASDGVKAVVFNPDDQPSDALLSQTFTTVVGQRYELSFDLGCVGGVNDRRTRVTVNGATLLADRKFNVAGLDTGPFYVPERMTFVANSTNTTLTFDDVTDSHLIADSLLDNVQVVPVDAMLPVITSDPERTAVGAGQDATFDVQVSGPGPFLYQWRFNGTAIAGANEASYTVLAANAASAGNYSVVVTNAAGSLATSAGVLTVLQPSILLNGSFEVGSAAWVFNDAFLVEPTLNPAYETPDGRQVLHFGYGQRPSGGVASQTVATVAGEQYVLRFNLGANSSLNHDEQRIEVRVQGTSSTPLFLQTLSLFAPGTGSLWLPQEFSFVADSTATTLSFTDLSATTMNVDPVLDNIRVILSSQSPAITDQPDDLSVTTGDPATFAVAATGPAPLFYEWRFNGVTIEGATGGTYTIPSALPANAGSYTVVVSNPFGEAISNPAALNVSNSAGFTNGSFESDYAAWTHTGSQAVVSGSFWTTTDGVKAVAFNIGNGGSNDSVLSQAFATTPGQSYSLTFDVGALSEVNHSEQRLQVTVTGGSTTLLSQTVSVFAPGNGTQYVPQSLPFTANSTTTTLTFRDVSSTSFNVDMMLDHVNVGLQAAPVITTQPQSQTVSVGATTAFSVVATGAGLSYQWRFNGTAISGAIGASHTITNVQTTHGGNYDVVVSNGDGSATSAVATLTVQTAPVITTQPQGQTANVGGTAVFSVVANGTGLSYQWRLNGTDIAGATGASYTITNVQTTHDGTYDVVVTNGAGSTTSASAALTVLTGATPPFTNGSFEADLNGWTATGNLVVVSGSFWVATDGVKAVAFNAGQSAANGVLVQTFATTAGQTYRLDLDVGATSCCLIQSEQRLQVIAQGQSSTLLSTTISVFAPGNGTQYVPQTLFFTADGPVTTLTLRDTSLTSMNIDLMLDNVRVTASTGDGMTNGSFEEDLTGWTATGQQRIATSDSVHPASDGAKAVVFDNPENLQSFAVLSQLVMTVPGQRYRLAFDGGATGRTADQLIRVTLEGTGSLFDQTIIVNSPTGDPFYVPQHIPFVANSATTRVTLADLSSTYWFIDGLLDNVRIIPDAAQAPLVTSQPQRAAAGQGGSATFSVGVSGTGPFSYAWQFNGAPIPGATASSYMVTGADAGKAGNYSVIVTNTSGSVSSSSATLTVVPAAILLNGSFEYGSAVWTFSNNSVAASTSPNWGPTDGNQIVHFNWGQQPPDGRLSQSFATTPGQQYLLTFDAGAYSTLNHNEQRMQVTVEGNTTRLSQNISLIGPGTGPAYVPQQFTFTADSTVSVLAFQDTSPSTDSIDLLLDNVRVAVSGAPIITQQPQSQTVSAGGTAVFSVVASGTGLSYQWRFNGTNISGATGTSHTITNVQTTHAGDYDVIVTNSAGPTTSEVAVLTVQVAPVITTQPQSQTVSVGGTAVFSVVASGTGLSYQWRFNGTNISGATGTSHTIANVQTTHAGDYDVVVTNSAGPTTSAVAVLTVQVAPVITTQPQSQTVSVGGTAVFSVVASGTGLSYQWRFNGTNISGATGTSHTIANVQTTHAGDYDVVVTNSAGPTTSAAAVLTVQTVTAPPFTNGSFESNYTGWTVTGNQDLLVAGSVYTATNGVRMVRFNAGQATPNGVLSQTFATVAGQAYTLQFDAGAVSSLNQSEQRVQVTVQGQAATPLLQQTVSVFAPGNGTRYVAQSFAFTADTGFATLTFRDTSPVSANVDLMLDFVRVTAPGPVITTQPQSQAVSVGGTAQFSVVANGTDLSYLWRFNGTAISGATGSSHTIANVQTTDAGNYDVVVTNGAGSTTSTVATLAVQTGPVIATQPQSQTVSVGDTAQFTVVASGTGLSYQWRFNGTAISGAMGSSHTIANVQTTHAGNYDVVVTNGAGSTTSAVATLTVQTGPVITTQPQSQTVSVGGTAQFTVVASGTGLSYQWRFNGTAISGATGSSHTIANVQTTHEGNYDVVVTNSAGPTTSAVAVLTVQTVTAPPFTNGSFESGYAGWTVTGNQDLITAGPFYTATNGVRAVRFNAGQTAPNGVLSQVFATTAGQVYTLRLDVGAVSGLNQSEQRLQVTVQGQASTPLLQQTVSVFAPGNGTRYVAQSLAFTADNNAATISLRDVSTTSANVDLMLDDVRITAAP